MGLSLAVQRITDAWTALLLSLPKQDIDAAGLYETDGLGPRNDLTARGTWWNIAGWHIVIAKLEPTVTHDSPRVYQ